MRSRTVYYVSFLCAWVIISGLISCSKKDQPAPAVSSGILNFSLFPGKDISNLEPSKHWISVRVSDTVLSGKDLIASFTLSPGAGLAIDGLNQKSGITKNDFGNDLHYAFISAGQQTQQAWTVQASNNDYSIMGPGTFYQSFSQRKPDI